MPRPSAHRGWFATAMLLLSIAALAAEATAQPVGAGALNVGTRLRISVDTTDNVMPSRRATGRLDALTRDSVTMTWDSGLRSTLKLAHVARIERSLGTAPYVKRGIALGLLGGAIAGAAWGAIAYEEQAFLDLGPGPDMITHGLLLGAVGAVVGGVVGAQGRWERWLPIHPGRLTFAPLPGQRLHALGVVVRF